MLRLEKQRKLTKVTPPQHELDSTNLNDRTQSSTHSRISIKESKNDKNDFEKLKEFERTNSERNLEESKGWILGKNRSEIQRKNELFASNNCQVGVTYWGVESIYSLPCLKRLNSLWIRIGLADIK